MKRPADMWHPTHVLTETDTDGNECERDRGLRMRFRHHGVTYWVTLDQWTDGGRFATDRDLELAGLAAKQLGPLFLEHWEIKHEPHGHGDCDCAEWLDS